MRRRIVLTLLAAAAMPCIAGCAAGKNTSREAATMTIDRKPFGKTPDGRTVDVVTMSNPAGIEARVITLGGIIVSFQVPDGNGKTADVVLGFDKLEDYLEKSPYFGAITGRYANRIAKGKFTIDGTEYTLATNNGPNHLHGGVKGFDKVLWKVERARVEDNRAVLELSYLSKDGEEGYPGNLRCTVTYTLTSDDIFEIHYEAATDKPTVVNLTNHTYWNLAGQGSGDILAHELMLNADAFTPVDEELIPTGEIKPVKDTPMDFTSPKTIGSRIDQLEIGGYDHNFVLNGRAGQMKLCARVHEPTTGRVMEIRTTEPGVQFYTGNFLDGTITGKDGKIYRKHYAFCLETQHFPDSPNKPQFPSVILRPGQTYRSTTLYKFYTK